MYIWEENKVQTSLECLYVSVLSASTDYTWDICTYNKSKDYTRVHLYYLLLLQTTPVDISVIIASTDLS